MSFQRQFFLSLCVSAAVIAAPVSASAETILGALAKAYQNNSTLNASRAGVRVTDEGVALAKSGMRPRVQGTARGSLSTTDGTERRSAEVGVSLTQPLFDGFQTRNNVLSAESGVGAAVEGLRDEELNTLFKAAQAYMNVIRSREVAELRRQSLEFLNEQVRAAQSRFDVGEGTRTDVAQARARLQTAQALREAARADVEVQAAIYQQVVGEAPQKLKFASPLSKLLPGSLESAVRTGLAQHPAVKARQHQIDAASFSVKASEGSLLPQLSGSASLTQGYQDSSPGLSSDGSAGTASVGIQLTVPIYQGGQASAQVRQNKERLGQARINLDVARDQVRAAVISAWAQYDAAGKSLAATRQSVSAAQLALDGVIEEQKVGQRTTLDVLDAQADVINARIELANAQRELVVGSYAVLQATGQLSARKLALKVTEYRPEEHYEAVKDKWYGLRTPDGR